MVINTCNKPDQQLQSADIVADNDEQKHISRFFSRVVDYSNETTFSFRYVQVNINVCMYKIYGIKSTEKAVHWKLCMDRSRKAQAVLQFKFWQFNSKIIEHCIICRFKSYATKSTNRS